MQSEAIDTEAGASARFDHIAELACLGVEADVGLITLITADRQIFKAMYNLPEPWAGWGETPLSHSICMHVAEMDKPLAIEDTLHHPLVSKNPVVADLSVYAYMGHPIHSPDGTAIGAICTIQNKVRHWTRPQKRFLSLVGEIVDREIRHEGWDALPRL